MAAAASAMNTGDWISAVLALVQIAAIVIGALWAYYKFFRGRIFHKRAEPTVEPTLVRLGTSYAVRAKLTLENTGSSDIPLRLTLLTLLANNVGDVDENGHLRWREIGRAHAFKDDSGNPDHDEIESQETITDDLLIPIGPDDTPDKGVLAYRVICHVYEKRTDGRDAICWTTKAIVPAGPEGGEPTNSVPLRERAGQRQIRMDVGRFGLTESPSPRTAQRPASEAEIEEAERE